MTFNPFAPPDEVLQEVAETPMGEKLAPAILPHKSLPKTEKSLQIQESNYTGIHLVGAHGGAGVTAVALRIASARDFGQKWPSRGKVILCAQASATGLAAAEEKLRLWAGGAAGNTQLLGLYVWSPTKRLGKTQRAQIRKLSALVPNLWVIPHISSWLTEIESSTQPMSFIKFRKQLEKEN